MNSAERVLVVEDDALVAEVVLAALALLPGVEAVHVDEGRRALIRLTTDRWNLVLSDIELPGADGLEILRAAKDADPDLPVVLMTAHEKLDYAIAAVRGHADEFLVKPIDPHALTATVKQLLGAARARREATNEIRRTVLAVGVGFDELVVGCGGTLLDHAGRGHRVVALALTGGSPGATADEARSVAEVLGIELVHVDVSAGTVSEGGETFAAIAAQVERLTPDVVLTHSLNDHHADHRDVHRATVVAARDVPRVLAYESSSTGITFAPGRFVDVTPYLDAKLRALREFRSDHALRPYLQEDLVSATARYWSRFGAGRHVEPLEVLRSSEPAVSPGGAPAARADAY